MDRRVDIAEGPFIGGQLPIGVHIAVSSQQEELSFGKIDIDHRHG